MDCAWVQKAGGAHSLTKRARASQNAREISTAKMSSILRLADIIAGDVATQLTWLQNRGLLPQRKTCPACNHAMDMQPRNDVCDKFRYSILLKIIHYHIKMGYMMMTVVDGDVQCPPAENLLL